MAGNDELRDILEDTLELKFELEPSDCQRVATFLMERQLKSELVTLEPEVSYLPCLILGQTLICLSRKNGEFVKRCLFWNLKDKNRHLMEIKIGEKVRSMASSNRDLGHAHWHQQVR